MSQDVVATVAWKRKGHSTGAELLCLLNCGHFAEKVPGNSFGGAHLLHVVRVLIRRALPDPMALGLATRLATPVACVVCRWRLRHFKKCLLVIRTSIVSTFTQSLAAAISQTVGARISKQNAIRRGRCNTRGVVLLNHSVNGKVLLQLCCCSSCYHWNVKLHRGFPTGPVLHGRTPHNYLHERILHKQCLCLKCSTSSCILQGEISCCIANACLLINGASDTLQRARGRHIEQAAESLLSTELELDRH
mmetsp:Transcript_34733/g.68552  ORF Transcript_34733/g.68552 Transcript_34733/m.68552 type:complete len:248 (-) Transcript_34733:53-796(-)